MRKITFLFSFLAMFITASAQNAGFNIQDATDADGLGGYTSLITSGNAGLVLATADVGATVAGGADLNSPGNGTINGLIQTFSPALDPANLQFGAVAMLSRGANTVTPRSPGPNNTLTVTLTTDIGNVSVPATIQNTGFNLNEGDVPVYTFDFSTVLTGATEVTQIQIHTSDALGVSLFAQSRYYDVEFTSTNPLSIAEVSEIPGASITAEGGSITVEGANLDAVYALTGQQVNAYGLPNGIYIVRVSKGGQSSTLKVIMD